MSRAAFRTGLTFKRWRASAARLVRLHHASLGARGPSSGTVSELSLMSIQAILTQGSFAPETLLPISAPTSPCAAPDAPILLSSPYRGCPCRLRQPRLVIRSLPALLCSSLPECCAPYPGGLLDAHGRVLLQQSSAFAILRRARLPAMSHQTTSRGYSISGLQAFLDVTALGIARPPGRSVPSNSRSFDSTRGLLLSSFLLNRHLLSSRVSLPGRPANCQGWTFTS